MVLHGVDQAGSEYTCSHGYGVFDNGAPYSASPSQLVQNQIAQERNVMGAMASWHINSVFIGLNEDCWLGINGINHAYAGQGYIDAIKAAVTAAESHGIYPVIGFFWGDPGSEVSDGNDPNGGGQPPMPDNDHTPLFWEEVADTFKGDSNVIFRLQEEPHPDQTGTSLAAWECWAKGDVQYDTGSVRSYGTAPVPVSSASHCNEDATNGSTHYATVGMQSLINVIRGTGATNVVQVPGLAWANMAACSPTGNPLACGMLDASGRIRPTDPAAASEGGPQLMADFDMYPDQGQICDSPACYSATLAPVAAAMPVDLGEIGPNGSTDTQAKVLLTWMDLQHQSYYAWAWDTWGGLVTDDATGAPAGPWGTDYKNHITP